MIRLVTERLILREIEERDLGAFAAYFADPEVVRYLDGQVLDRAQTWRMMATVIGHGHLRGYSFWALEERATGAVVGRAGLWNPEGWPGLEVGWTLGRPHWGKGYATEAGRAALDYAFDVLDAPRVLSVIHPENQRSIRVAERLGETFDRRGTVKGVDVLIYGINRPPAGARSATSTTGA